MSNNKKVTIGRRCDVTQSRGVLERKYTIDQANKLIDTLNSRSCKADDFFIVSEQEPIEKSKFTSSNLSEKERVEMGFTDRGFRDTL